MQHAEHSRSSSSGTQESSSSSMFALRLVTLDHYLASPSAPLDPLVSKLGGWEVWQVPVVRIFGVTPAGQKACLHVHGAMPYLTVPCAEPRPERFAVVLASEIDLLLNTAAGRATSMHRHVHHVAVIHATRLYGFHDREETFLRIFLYNPLHVAKVAELLLSGLVQKRVMQPHEAHIPFALQFMVDHNLHGMSFVRVESFKFRRTPSWIQDKCSIRGTGLWDLDSLPAELFGNLEKQTTCELELDCCARDILNASDKEGLNPGLAALWQEEEERRQEPVSWLPLSTEDEDFPRTESEQFYLARLDKRLARPTVDEQDRSGTRESRRKHHSHILDTSHGVLDSQDEALAEALAQAASGWSQGEPCEEDSILGSLPCPDGDEADEDEDNAEDMSQVFQLVGDREQDDDGVSSMSDQSDGNEAYDPFQLDGADDTPGDASARGSSTRDQGTQTGARPPVLVRRLLGRARTRRCTRLSLRRQQQQQRQATQECQQPERLPGSTSARLVGRLPDEVGASPPVAEDWQRWQSCHVASLLMSPESYSTPSTLTASSPAPEPSPSYAPVDTERSRESEAVLPCSVKLLRLTEDEVNRWQRRPPPAEVHHKRRSWHEPECHGGGRNRIVLEEDVPKPRKRRKKRGCSASSSTSSMVLRSSPPAEEVDLRVPASSSTSEGITTEADHRAPLWGAATTVCGEVVPGGSVNSGTQGVRKRLEAGGDKTGSGTNKSRLRLQSVDQGEGTSSLELPPGTSSAMNSVADHGASPRQEQSCAERKVSSKPDWFVEARRPVSVASTSSSPASSLSSSQDVNGLGELKASECRPSVICRIRIRGKRMISTTTTRLVPIVVGLENDQGFNTPATSSSSCEAAEIPSSTAVTGTSTLAPQNSEAGRESALLHPVQNYKPSFSKGKSSRRLAKSKLSASTVPDASMDASISDLVSRFSRCEVVMAASSEGSEAEVTSDITKCDLSKATNVTASSEASVDKEGLIAKPVYSELTDSVTPVISAVTDDGNMLVQPFSNVTGEVGSFGGGLPSSGSPRVKGGHKRDGPRRSATAVYLGGDDRGERKDSSPVEERNMTQSAGRRTRWRAAKLSSSKLGLRRSSRLEAVVSPSSCEVSDLERSDSGLHKRISPSKGVKLSTHLSRHQIAVEEAETPRIVFRPRCAKGTDFASAQVNHLGIEETVIPERSVCASVLTEKDAGVIVESKEPQVVPSGKPSCVNILDEKESSPNRTANCESEGKDKAKISASKLALNKVEASNATPSVSMTAITERDSVGAAGKMPAVHSGSFKTHGSSALIVSHAINAKNTSICGPNDTEVTITHEPLKLRASKSSRALKKQVESPPVPSRRLRTRSALRDACEAGVQKADVSYEKLELTRPPVPSGDGELLTSSSIDEVAGSQEPLSSSLETFTKEISRNQGRPRKVKTKNSVDIGKERTAKLVSEGLLPDGANADALLGSGSDTQLAGSPILSEVHSHSAGSQELLSGDTFRKVCLRKRGRPSKVKDKCSTGTNKERTKVTSEALVPDGTSGDALRNSGSDIQWSSSPILTEAHSQPAGSQVLPNDSLDTFRKESPRKRGRPRKVEDKCSPDTGKERKTKVVSEGLVPDGVNVDALLSAGSDSQWVDSRTLTNVHSQPDAAACVDDREGKSLERRQTRRRKANIAAPDAVKRGSQVSELMASEGMVIGASLNSSCADVRHQRTPEQRAAVGASSPTQGSCLVREKNTELATKLVVAELGGKGSPMSRSPLSSGSKDKQEARSPVLCKSPDISTSSAGDHSVGGLSSGFTDAVSKHCTAVLPIPGKHSVKHIDQGTDDLTLTEPSPHERSVSSIEKGRDVFQNSKLAPTSSAEATSTACRKQQPELAEELFQLEAALSRANLADDAEVVTAENAGTEEASATPANNSLCLGSDDEENWILLDEAGDDSVELFSSSDEMAEPASREGCKDGVGSDEDIGDKGKDDGSRDNLVSCDSSEDTSGAQDSSRTCLEDVCEKNCVDINGEGSPVETGHGAEVGSETCAVGTSAEVTLAVGNEQFGEISCGDVGENFGSGSSICNISCETGGEFIASENFTEDVDLGESEELFGQVTSTPKGEEDSDSTFTGKPLQVIITRLDDVDVHSHLGQLYVKAKQAMKPCCERSAGCSDAQASDHVRNRRLYHSEARQTGAADQDCAKRSARRSDQKHARRKLGSEELHVADEDVAVSLSAKKPGKQRERRLGVLEAQETDKVDQESSKLPSSRNSDQQHSRRRLNTEVLEVTAMQQAGADASSARQPEKLCKGRFGEAEETGLVDQDATKFSSSRKSDKQNTEVLEATAVQQAGADASSPRQPEKLSKGRFDEAEETGLVDQDVTKFSSSRKSDQQHMKRRLDSEDLERAMMGEESADPSSTSKSEKQLSEKSLYSEPQQAGILDHDSAKSSTEKLLLPQPDIAKVPGLLDQVLDNYELPDALKCLLDAEMPFPELDADCFNLPHDPARWLPDDGTVEKPKFDERPPLKEDPPFCPSDESMLGDLAKACSLTTEGLVVLVPAVPPPSFNAPQLSSSYTKRARDRPKGLAFWQKAKLEAFARDSCFEVDFDHNPELRIAFCRDRTVVLTPARCPPTAALLASLCRRPPSPEDDGVSTYEPLHDEASPEPVTPVATPPRHETSTSQLDGPTGRFALSGARLPTDMERVLTVLSVEVHVRTRGDLCPDPGQDAIHCVIWCARGHGEEAPVEAGAMHWALCDPRLPDVEDLVSMSLRRTGVAGPTLRTQVVRSERDLLLAFVDLVHRWDPDVLLGYDAERASWGYLCERAERLELDLYARLSRAPPPPGRKEFVGRILLSVWRILRKEITLNIYTFENAYYHVMHRRVPLYSFRTLSEWFSQDLFRWRVVEHYVLRARGNLELLDELNVFGKTSQMASVYGIQFLEVLSRGSQFRVESMLLRLVRSRRMVALSPSTAQRAKQRAPEFIPLVLEPRAQLYTDPVVVLDFQSLYPSVIIAHNYCFSTCLGRIESLGSASPFGCSTLEVPLTFARSLRDHITVSPAGVAFVRPSIRKGLLPQMLDEVLGTRLMVKKAMSLCTDQALRRVLDAQQLSLKLIANVTYGYTAASFSGRMPCVEVADSVVSKGREALERAIRTAEATVPGARVIYGDTDSLFVLLEGRSRREAFQLGQEIADRVTAQNPRPMCLRMEKVYQPCVLQTKKRYVGFAYEHPDQQEPKYDAKGIETVRRDTCPAVAKLLEKMLRVLFTTQDVNAVKRFVKLQFSKILSERVSPQDFIFAREFRGLHGYQPSACVPALEIARRLVRRDPRAEPLVGERVPYVVVYGHPGQRLIELVRQPHELLGSHSQLRLNAHYYVARAIGPALNRVLRLLGANCLQWYEELPRPRFVNPRPGTVAAYLVVGQLCLACGGQSESRQLCTSCEADPAYTALVLGGKVQRVQKSLLELQTVCHSCMGFQASGACVSTDCPVLYKTARVTAEAQQALVWNSARSASSSSS